MDRLVDCLLKFGLMPCVVPEFTGITVGGAFNGTGGESSSFKYGFFHESVTAVEMVLAEGSVVNASEVENADLFHGSAEALGTLGVTTLLHLRLVRAPKYVKVTYHRTRSVQETVDKLKEASTNAKFHFVDGMLFSQSHGVVVFGEATDELPPNATPQPFTGPWDPWFYLHVSSLTASSDTTQEYVPIYDYIFRYDRGVFWMAKYTFDYFPSVPFSPFTRWLADDFCRPRFLFSSLHSTPFAEEYVIQDMALPYESAADLVDWQAEELDIWPIWLCPLKRMPGPAHKDKEKDSTPCLNIGLWGQPRSYKQHTPEQLNLLLEDKLADLQGRKWLYALQYYNQSDFWQIYDKQAYDSLRKKYGASDLASIYDKVRRHAASPSARPTGFLGRMAQQWPWTGLIGLWAGLMEGRWGQQYTQRGAWPDVMIGNGQQGGRHKVD